VKYGSKMALTSVGAAFGPFLVGSAYLMLSRWPKGLFTTTCDWVALAVSVLIGASFILCMPLGLSFRIFLICLYVPLFACLLLLYGLYFVGFVWGDWL
jgi:hypothetical protein